jgi:cyanophycinase
VLAFVGSGEYLPEMETVDRFLLNHLEGSCQVVCLPTAAGTEGSERIAYWSELGVNHFRRLGAKAEAVPVINRQDAFNAELAGRVAQANFVYLSGGKPDYLLSTLEDSLVWQAILEVIHRGGILAGCSAGAMVMGQKIPGFPLLQDALNLMPGAVIIPHFNEIPGWMVSLLRVWVGWKIRLVGVPGSTALVVNGNECQVVGKAGVMVGNTRGIHQYAVGEKFTWNSFSR